MKWDNAHSNSLIILLTISPHDTRVAADNCSWGGILVRNWLYISVTRAIIERLYSRMVSNWLVLKDYCHWIRTRRAGILGLRAWIRGGVGLSLFPYIRYLWLMPPLLVKLHRESPGRVVYK